MFHKEILTEEQLKLLPLIRKFKRNCYLVGGTAIALQLAHRRSINFDLFTKSNMNRESLEERIKKYGYKFKVIEQTPQELIFIIGKARITFHQFFYSINAAKDFEEVIRVPSLLDLAALSALALGDRVKWKDYIDLYFIFKNNISLKQIVKKASSLFAEGFSEKLFREQLSYFEGIDNNEAVQYLVPEPSKDKIKQFLTKIALQ